MKKSWKYLLPLVVFLVLAGFLFKGLYLDPREVPSALIGKPAPEFSLPTLYESSRKVTKADLLGKVYLLNVWASWCPTCQYEHPFFMKLKERGERVPLIGYNLRDKPAPAKQWLESYGNPYDDIVVDADGRTSIDFGVYGAPETFVIDKKGTIRHKVIGLVNEEEWKKTIEPLVRRLERE